jgi:CHAT domain-containing protein
VQDEIAARRPAHGTLSGQRAPLRAGEIRSRVLLPGQLLVEYLVGAEHTFLFCLDASHLEVHVIPWGADSIAAEVRALREALLADEPPAGAAHLHALLLGPIEALLEPGSRLLIVPDGPLFYLPFALLHDGERYLIERHALCQAPSASVLDHELWDRSCGGRPKLLAVGNPASFRSQHLLSQTRRATRDWSFGELPFAEEEVRRVAAYFARDDLLIGAAATEEVVKARMGAVNHLHFATHGMLDEREPLMSALVLAQDEDPREDGFLQVHEILEQSLCADLVVLSACNTGLGKIMTGEGVLGLTHAFMYAGARTLLISLWEVPDQSTAILMDRFYGALSEGLPADEALQKAQRAAIDAGVVPREWAGFALSGYADLRSLAPRGFAGVGRPMRMAALGLSVLLAILLVTLAVRRSKRQT